MTGSMEFKMRFHKGGGGPGSPPPPPPPPAPATAAENVRRLEEFRRRRQQYGFAQTILTSPQGVSGMNSQNTLKTLLGG